ncbi:MAG TPA: VWA domain-containing protein [Thermoanaerobaculia bacterium]|nr:VWA domain-containing protein [Thermoanaerobaculia bacterium]
MNARTAVLALIVTVLHASPATTQQATPFSETVEVRVTNVEVVVTDRSGKPVHGLTKDDFEVFENGGRQLITNFAEIRETTPSGTLTTSAPEAAPADAPRETRRRVITLFVDNATLEMGNRNTVLPQLRQFLAAHVRPGDAVAVYLWGNGLSAQLELTDDQQAIAKALGSLGTLVARGGPGWRAEFEHEIEDMISNYKPEKPRMQEAISIASAYALRATSEMRLKSEALKSVISSLRGLEGRKVLVLLTQQLSTNPGEGTFYFLESIRDQFASPDVLRPTSEARHYVLQDLARDIAAVANTAGVTLYPINASGLSTDMGMRDSSQTSFLANSSSPHTDTSTSTLHAIADETGGRATAGSANWQLAFDTIANDLGVYYSLGYRTPGERQDRTKRVEVQLRDKRGYTVRTRKSIVEQTASTEMTDAVTSHLFHTRAPNDLGIQTRIGNATPSGKNLVHPLTIAIPTSTLTLIPDGSEMVGTLSVFTAFLRADGAVSKVGKQTNLVRFPAASIANRKAVFVKIDVTADPTVTAISVGVLDEASRATGFAIIKLPIGSAGL